MKKPNKGSILILSLVVVVVMIGISGSILFVSASSSAYSEHQKKQYSAYYVSFSGLQASVIACNNYKNSIIQEVHGNALHGWESVIVKVDNEWKDLYGIESSLWPVDNIKHKILYDSTHDENNLIKIGGKKIKNRNNFDFEVYLEKSGEDYLVHSSGLFSKIATALKSKFKYETVISIIPRNAGDKKVIFDGGPIINSLDDNSDVDNNSSFSSNGDVVLGGDVTYKGELHPGTSANFIEKGGIIIPPPDKTLSEATANLEEDFYLPPVDIVWPKIEPEYDVKFNPGLDKVPTTWSGVKYFVQKTSTAALSLGGGRIIVEGDTTVYLEGNFDAGGQAYIEIPEGSKLTIYCSGNIKMNGASILNVSNKPENFYIYSSYETVNTDPSLVTSTNFPEDIYLNGGSVLHAMIYAPKANVRINGSNDFIGNLTSYMMYITGSALYTDKVIGERTVQNENYIFYDSNLIKGPIKDEP